MINIDEQAAASTRAVKHTALDTKRIMAQARQDRLSAAALHVRRAEDRWRIAREQEFARSGWVKKDIWSRIDAIADSNATAIILYLGVVLFLYAVAAGWITR